MNDETKIFLTKARKSTYASGMEAEMISLGKTYSIKDGNLEYRDIYFDQERYFQGQEIIFENEKPVFSMSYRGAAVEGTDTKEVFSFLQKILREHSDEVRLPGNKEYNDGDWRYEDRCTGDFSDFEGEEKIYQSDKLVHWMKYFGGKIK